MLKIYINGESGKMGASIIKLIDDDDTFIKVEKGELITADVVIDFSHPNSTLEILQDCLENKKALVIGTTGLKNNLIKISVINALFSSSSTIVQVFFSQLSTFVFFLGLNMGF